MPFKAISGRGEFAQLSLQGAPVHIEGARSGGDIALMLLQDALDMFPFKAVDR
jgi:hypothetical protein